MLPFDEVAEEVVLPVVVLALPVVVGEVVDPIATEPVDGAPAEVLPGVVGPAMLPVVVPLDVPGPPIAVLAPSVLPAVLVPPPEPTAPVAGATAVAPAKFPVALEAVSHGGMAVDEVDEPDGVVVCAPARAAEPASRMADNPVPKLLVVNIMYDSFM